MTKKLYIPLFSKNENYETGATKIAVVPGCANRINGFTSTECFIDLGKLNLLKISLPWSKSVKLLY
jgi:hypothetical protein